MSELISEINPLEYEIDLKEFPLEGSESKLFKGRRGSQEIALKVYPEIAFEQIKLYAMITNKLAEMLNPKDEYLEIEIGGKKEKFLLRIVPVKEIGFVEFEGKKSPCSVSEFIEGRTLQDLSPHFISESLEGSNVLKKLSKRFCQETGVEGLGIIPWNIKIKPGNPGVAYITDISGAVRNIRKVNS